MQQTIDLALVQAYSRGEITRRDIEDVSGRPCRSEPR